jgi:hypothetical protein
VLFARLQNSAHYWQAFIEKLFRGASGGFQTVLKKVGGCLLMHQTLPDPVPTQQLINPGAPALQVIVDQCSYGPLCNILFM